MCRYDRMILAFAVLLGLLQSGSASADIVLTKEHAPTSPDAGVRILCLGSQEYLSTTGKLFVKNVGVFIAPVADALFYSIYRKSDSDPNYRLIGTTLDTVFVDFQVHDGGVFTYMVRYYSRTSGEERPGTMQVEIKIMAPHTAMINWEGKPPVRVEDSLFEDGIKNCREYLHVPQP